MLQLIPLKYAILAKIAIKGLRWLSNKTENDLDSNIVDFMEEVVDIAAPTNIEKLETIKEIILEKDQEKIKKNREIFKRQER